jgi:hypothetical protein
MGDSECCRDPAWDPVYPLYGTPVRRFQAHHHPTTRRRRGRSHSTGRGDSEGRASDRSVARRGPRHARRHAPGSGWGRHRGSAHPGKFRRPTSPTVYGPTLPPVAVGWSEVAAGVVGGLVGAALRPWAERVVPAPGRMKRARRRVDRAWTDHTRWVERRQREMQRELERAREDLGKVKLVLREPRGSAAGRASASNR